MVGPHVIGIGKPVVFVETVLKRQELGGIAQMPFAEDSRTIAFLLQEFTHRHFFRVDAIVRIGAGSTGKTDTVRIAAGQQTGTRCTADGLAGQKVSKPHALCRQVVDIRRRIAVGSVAGEITVTHIVQINQNHIGIVLRA